MAIGQESTERPRIGAIAPWFGGKRSLAPTIVEELGEHAAYWEPACGSMAVLFAKPPSAHETVNDLHGDLINLAMVVASDRAPELYLRLQRTIMVEDTILAAKAQISKSFDDPPNRPDGVRDSDIDRAYWYFVMSWGGRNGVSGTKRFNYQMAVRWTPGGGAGGIRFTNAVESLPWWHRRLRKALILHRNLFDVLPRIEDVPGVAIYLDPPYLRSGARSGSCKYLHEFDSDDHRRLAAELRRFQNARVVVSYYDDPALAKLYPDWTKRDVYRQKNLHSQNRRGSSKNTAPEVLLLNGPSYAKEEGGLFAAQGGEENSIVNRKS